MLGGGLRGGDPGRSPSGTRRMGPVRGLARWTLRLYNRNPADSPLCDVTRFSVSDCDEVRESCHVTYGPHHVTLCNVTRCVNLVCVDTVECLYSRSMGWPSKQGSVVANRS